MWATVPIILQNILARRPCVMQEQAALGTLLASYNHDAGYDSYTASRGYFQRAEERAHHEEKLHVSRSDGEV